MTKSRMQAEKDEKQKKTATPAPVVSTEDSAISSESSGAQVAAVPVKPTPESHPHLFDEFGNPR